MKSRKLASFLPEDINKITPEEVQCLIYELQCYQIELEMQNDELRQAQLKLTDLNNRLQLTYHQVPVGILTLNKKGFIQEANFYFAKMMNTTINQVLNKPFSRFISDEDLYEFIRNFNEFFIYPENKNIQLQLKGDNAKAFPVIIKAIADDGNDVTTEKLDIESRKLVIVVTEIGAVMAEE